MNPERRGAESRHGTKDTSNSIEKKPAGRRVTVR
jgi:hypothetical protein